MLDVDQFPNIWFAHFMNFVQWRFITPDISCHFPKTLCCDPNLWAELARHKFMLTSAGSI